MREELIMLAASKNYYSFHTVNREVGNGWFIELCLLQKWLREIHKIDLWVERYNENEMYIFQCPKLNLEKILGYFKTYEEALEIGLQEALKLLPDVNI